MKERLAGVLKNEILFNAGDPVVLFYKPIFIPILMFLFCFNIAFFYFFVSRLEFPSLWGKAGQKSFKQTFKIISHHTCDC